MKILKKISIITLALIIIGGLNWGFVGLFGLNLIDTLFGNYSAASRILYALVGISALYVIYNTLNISGRH